MIVLILASFKLKTFTILNKFTRADECQHFTDSLASIREGLKLKNTKIFNVILLL